MPTSSESAATGRPFNDAPHPVVIELDQPITCAQAQELGKVLGQRGYTGKFVGGDVAALVILGAEYRSQQARCNRDKKQGEQTWQA